MHKLFIHVLMIMLTLFINNSANAENVKDSPMANFDITEKQAALLVGITCRTQNVPEKAPVDIPALWDKFFQNNIQAQIPNKISDEIIALYTDYEGDYTKPYSLIIGCLVSSDKNLPEGLVSKKIPGGNFAKFNAKGKHPDALINTWQNIWNLGDLPRKYSGDFEVYNEKFQKDPQEVEVFIAIE